MTIELTEEERLALLEALSDALENYAQESTSYDADLRAVRAKLAAPAPAAQEPRPDALPEDD